MDELEIGDLAKVLVREYLYENKFFKTFEAFEGENPRGKNKISRNLIIKNLCLEYLVVSNKKSSNPLKSLLDMLVEYLKNKYVAKKMGLGKARSSIGRAESVASETFQALNVKEEVEIKKEPLSRTHMNFRPGSAKKIKKIDVPVEEFYPKVLSKNAESSSTNCEQEEKNTINEQINLRYTNEIPTLSKVPELAMTISQGMKINPRKDDEPLEPIQTQKAKKMISMFGKRKVDKKEEPEKVPDIFSLPNEEQHKPITYSYQPLKFDPFVLKQEVSTPLIYKKITTPADKFKKKLKPIQQDLSSQVRKTLFQGHSKALPKAWKQGILLSPFQNTYYGLQQIEGGPCGVVAALQCYFLKHLLYLSKEDARKLETRENCLVAAISDMLYSINPNKVVLVIPSIINTYAKDPIPIQDTQLLTLSQPKDLNQVYEAVYHNKSYFFAQNGSGYTLLLYSCILTKQLPALLKQMDNPDTPLIGNHGHCNQQLVNLFITFKASTNIFNGTKTFGEDKDLIELKGVQEKSQFGFLTIFQTLGYVQAGTYLKNPVFPIWIVCKQFHYHVIFAGNYLISQNNATEKFDLVYFDGLYNCADKIILTLGEETKSKDKVSNLPLIEQVLLTKWGRREVDWNGSIKIL